MRKIVFIIGALLLSASTHAQYKHRVVVEEYTGTGCGYCPRGWQGMENLRETFGDDFIGIAIHQYNSSDAMYFAPSKYAQLGFTSAPNCKIERGYTIDPYTGSLADIRNDFRQALAVEAKVGVDVTATWNADMSQVNAKAVVETSEEGKTYTIEYVLVADGLKGTSTAWRQSNYYYQYSASDFPADLQKFCNGGIYGQKTISGLTFNDVAISASYVNSRNKAKALGTLSAHTPVTNEYTLTMPESTFILNALKYDQVYIVAIIVDSETKKIVNADKKLVGLASGINAIEGNEGWKVVNSPLNSRPSSFNLNGQRVDSDYRGIIIKNGKKILK